MLINQMSEIIDESIQLLEEYTISFKKQTLMLQKIQKIPLEETTIIKTTKNKKERVGLYVSAEEGTSVEIDEEDFHHKIKNKYYIKIAWVEIPWEANDNEMPRYLEEEGVIKRGSFYPGKGAERCRMSEIYVLEFYRIVD